MNDTHPSIEALQLELQRKCSPDEKNAACVRIFGVPDSFVTRRTREVILENRSAN